jgi:hypothetical protein
MNPLEVRNGLAMPERRSRVTPKKTKSITL